MPVQGICHAFQFMQSQNFLVSVNIALFPIVMYFLFVMTKHVVLLMYIHCIFLYSWHITFQARSHYGHEPHAAKLIQSPCKLSLRSALHGISLVKERGSYGICHAFKFVQSLCFFALAQFVNSDLQSLFCVQKYPTEHRGFLDKS